MDHVKEQGRTEDLNAAQSGSVSGSVAAAGLEEKHWLCPIEDRRRLDSAREGIMEGFSLGNYLLLVDLWRGSIGRGRARCRVRWPKSSTASAAVPIRCRGGSAHHNRADRLDLPAMSNELRTISVQTRLPLKSRHMCSILAAHRRAPEFTGLWRTELHPQALAPYRLVTVIRVIRQALPPV